MAATEVPWLGQRIREERMRRGVSLRALARMVGVSASMISQIETAKSQPSVSTLYGITSALGVSVEDLFSPEPAPAPAAALAAHGTVDAPVPRPALRGARLGPLVPPQERRVVRLESGVVWELLGELPHHSLDFLRISYPPGGSSSVDGALMRHPGYEYGFVVSGEMVLTLGEDEFRLAAGDAVSFDSTTPHRFRNEGTVPAVGIWFVVERGEHQPVGDQPVGG
ncbi:MAG: cupin domain-containing protein [Micromonosporaceae bacterium]|nr:cupin domain-containing protein [Micromonosporaceae bacterium]